MRTRAYKNIFLFFGKIWRALFSWNTRFEICPFALLPTNLKSYHEIHEINTKCLFSALILCQVVFNICVFLCYKNAIFSSFTIIWICRTWDLPILSDSLIVCNRLFSKQKTFVKWRLQSIVLQSNLAKSAEKEFEK